MASQTQGIQQLLQAEKRAAERVSEARKRKARRLKQAKEEAQAEIEQYRGEREKVYREREKGQSGSIDDITAKIKLDTDSKIQVMAQSVRQNQEVVIKRLLDLVLDVKPELHENFRQAA